MKRKTVKLFWKELKQAEGLDRGLKCKFGRGTVWASLDKVVVDSAKLEHLFESKAKELTVAKVTDHFLFTLGCLLFEFVSGGCF